MTTTRPLETIAALFASDGAAGYLGEPVSQAEHMLQAAHAAELAGEGGPLVAAALLHDVGHFHGTLTGADLMAGVDNHHSHTGARWLERWFGDEVTEPVRLHVAKRYLCAVEPGYFETLSAASVYTLSVQGGPMTHDEAASFSQLRFAKDAVRLRRCDEKAKEPDLSVPPLEAYYGLLEDLATRTASSRGEVRSGGIASSHQADHGVGTAQAGTPASAAADITPLRAEATSCGDPEMTSNSRLRRCETVPTFSPVGLWMPMRAPT